MLHVLPSFLASLARHRVVVVRLCACYMLAAPLLSLGCMLARWRPCSDVCWHSICWEGKSNGRMSRSGVWCLAPCGSNNAILWPTCMSRAMSLNMRRPLAGGAFFIFTSRIQLDFISSASEGALGSKGPRVRGSKGRRGPRVQGRQGSCETSFGFYSREGDYSINLSFHLWSL